jgi:DNA polymerase-3 subunit alpha
MPDGATGIQVLPPDINVSHTDFTPVYSNGTKKKSPGVIRFGLAAVKGVGQKAVQGIIEERVKAGAFNSLYDFCDRVNLQQVPKSTIEALIKCGAYSSVSPHRNRLLAALDKAVDIGQQSQQDRRLGQMSMFAAAADTPAARIHGDLPDAAEMPKAELLKFEKELLGFYITSHPLTERQAEIERYSTCSSRDIAALQENSEVTLGAVVSEVRKRVTKNGRSAGQQMALVTLEDLDGQIEATIFAESLADILKRRPEALAKESIVFVRGKVDKRREKPGLIVNDIIPIEEAASRLTTAVRLDLSQQRDAKVVEMIKPILHRHKGAVEVFVQTLAQDGRSVMMRIERDWFVRPVNELVKELETLLGEGSIQLAGVRRRRPREEQPLFVEEAAEIMAPAAEIEVE